MQKEKCLKCAITLDQKVSARYTIHSPITPFFSFHFRRKIVGKKIVGTLKNCPKYRVGIESILQINNYNTVLTHLGGLVGYGFGTVTQRCRFECCSEKKFLKFSNFYLSYFHLSKFRNLFLNLFHCFSNYVLFQIAAFQTSYTLLCPSQYLLLDIFILSNKHVIKESLEKQLLLLLEIRNCGFTHSAKLNIREFLGKFIFIR